MLWKRLTIFLLFLLVMVGMAIFYLLRQTRSLVPNNTEIADWKKYTNIPYGYSVKLSSRFLFDRRDYPNSLHFSLPNVNNAFAGLADVYVSPAQDCLSENQCLNNLLISLNGAKDAGSKSQFRQISATVDKRNVNGIEYWDYKINNLTYDYFLSNNGKILDFQFIINGYQDINAARVARSLVEQILSTFQSLDTTETTIPAEISAVFSELENSLNIKLEPVKTDKFYTPKGFVSQTAWEINLSDYFVKKSKINLLNSILAKYLLEDTQNTSFGIGESIYYYENKQVYCVLFQAEKSSLSCRVK